MRGRLSCEIKLFADFPKFTKLVKTTTLALRAIKSRAVARSEPVAPIRARVLGHTSHEERDH